MKITPGKQKGMKAVSDSRGVIAAAAMDQRGSLKSAIAKDKGIDKSAVTAQMLEEFKTPSRACSRPTPARFCSIPNTDCPPPAPARRTPGLLLAYENSGYDNTRPGRLPDLLDIWSVRRLVGAGADCIKILLYYTPFDRYEINDIKHAWVERIGAECIASDVPFFLECVGYEEGKDEKTVEFARKKPEVVTKSMEEFSKPQYAVDVLKVEVPDQHGLRRRQQSLQRRVRLHPRRGQRIFPQRRRCGEKAVHLSFRRRQQRCLQRNA